MRRLDEEAGPGRVGNDRSGPVRLGWRQQSGGPITGGVDLVTALAELERASRHRLAEQWARYFGAMPPPRTSRALLLRAVAYKLQEHALGGLSARARRRLGRPEPRCGAAAGSIDRLRLGRLRAL